MASFTLYIITKQKFRRKVEDNGQVNEHIPGGVFRYLRRSYHHTGVATTNAGIGKDTGYSRWLGRATGGTGSRINDKVTG